VQDVNNVFRIKAQRAVHRDFDHEMLQFHRERGCRASGFCHHRGWR
jgi:hypothetical protein